MCPEIQQLHGAGDVVAPVLHGIGHARCHQAVGTKMQYSLGAVFQQKPVCIGTAVVGLQEMQTC